MIRLSVVLLCIVCLNCRPGPAGSVVESKVVLDTLYSNELDRNVPYRVYLPGTYNADTLYPVIYLLHGHGGSDDDWFSDHEGRVQSILDSLIQNKLIPPLVAIGFDGGNSWYVDSKEPMESAYIKDFIPHIESQFAVMDSTMSRIMAGNSAGGYGALRFSLKYPELFHSVILLSPAAYYPVPIANSSSRQVDVFEVDGVFSDSLWAAHSYRSLLQPEDVASYPKYYVSAGDDDNYNIFEVISHLREFMLTHGIDPEITVTNGGHSWDVWRQNFANDLVRLIQDQ